MSSRFTYFYFSCLFLANLFFIEMGNEAIFELYDQVIFTFLFQFDYLFLFIYICFCCWRDENKVSKFLPLAYLLMFLWGFTFFMNLPGLDNGELYLVNQSLARFCIIVAIWKLDKTKRNSFKKTVLTLGTALIIISIGYEMYHSGFEKKILVLLFGLVLLVLIAKATQLNFRLKRIEKLFLVGTLLCLISDSFYLQDSIDISYELNYIVVRTISSIGEFLLVFALLTEFKNQNKLA